MQIRQSKELVILGEVVNGELLDETCACGNPGQLMADPYDAEANNGDSLTILCENCATERYLDA